MTSAIPQRFIDVYLIKRFSNIKAQRQEFSGGCKHSIITDNENKITFRMRQATGAFPVSHQIKPKGFFDRFYLFLLSSYLFLTRPTLSAYLVPYILALIAVVVGLADCLLR